MLRAIRILCAGLCAAVAWNASAHAEPPVTKLVTGVSVGPTNYILEPSCYSAPPAPPPLPPPIAGPHPWLCATSSQAYYPDVAPEIAALARTLTNAGGSFEQNAYQYVRNNIAVEFRYGLGKGGRGALIDKSGTPFDQAQLMSQLLRVRYGPNAGRYELSKITLDAQQFGLWTGLVKNLDPVEQTFEVDAKAACRFLSDGGFPALVNNTTNCNNLSGNLTTVTLTQIAVSGFDPSLKPHELFKGVDIAAALGCGTAAAPTCGASALSAAMTGASTGTLGGAPYVQNLNDAGLGSHLSTAASNYKAYLEANNPGATIEDILGGRKIDTKVYPASDWRGQQLEGSWDSSFFYVVQLYDIPDQFRTKVTLIGNNSQTFFADEIYGRRVLIKDGWIQIDDKGGGGLCTSGSACMLDLKVKVEPPYPAHQTHWDATYDFNLHSWSEGAKLTTVSFIFSLGDSGPSTQAYYADLHKAGPSGISKILHADGVCGAVCGADFGVYGAQLLSQQSSISRLVDQIATTQTTRHHTVGFMFVDTINQVQTFPAFTVASSVSVNSPTGDAQARAASFETTSILQGVVEGAILQQASDFVGSKSSAGLMALSVRTGAKILDVSSGNMASVLPLLTDYVQPRKDRLQVWVNAGYNVVLPSDGTPNQCILAPCPLVGGSYAYATDKSAPLVMESLKGGMNSDGPEQVAAALRLAKDAKASVSQREFAKVDLSSGDLALSPPPDIVSGFGDFPYSLPFTRTYRSSDGAWEAISDQQWIYEGPDDDLNTHLGSGWVHNYQYSARITSSIEEGLGRSGAFGAAYSLAGAFTLFDLNKTLDLQRRVSGELIANWVSEKWNNNAVVVSTPQGPEVFVRLPDGSFTGRPGGASKLVQTNERAPAPVVVGSSLAYNYGPIVLEYTGGEGSKLRFEPALQRNSVAWGRTFRPMTWTFPNGVKLTYSYTSSTNNGVLRYAMSGVSNNVGRSLTFGLANSVRYNVPFWRISSVSDGAGRTANYAVSNCPSIATIAVVLTCNVFEARTPDAAATIYKYDPDTTSPNPTIVHGPRYRLRRWYAPSNASTPFLNFIYDDLFRVATIRDALSHDWQYYAGSVRNDSWAIGAEQDPAGSKTRYLFNEFGLPAEVRDPLQNLSRFEYDKLGRLTAMVDPSLARVEQAYDLRSNILTVTRKPKPSSPLADIVTSTTYGEGPSVRVCSNFVICNKPTIEVDARGNTTTYTWDGSSGLPTKVVFPADDEGQQPQADIVYGPFGPAGSQFRLPTSKTEKISASESVVTAYTYNASNKYVPQTVAVDSTGLNLVTTYTFDTYGNITAVDAPRPSNEAADVTNYVWDVNRRLTLEIGADPDGGTVLRPATKFTYDVNGRLTTTERGTTTSATGSSFGVLEKSSVAYDAAGNRIRETVFNGNTTTILALTQTAYDLADRPTCVAVRMNPATFGSPPADACALGTAGANGADRISRTTYDLAGRKLVETEAFGTALAQDYATYTYTTTGKVVTVKDASGNLSTMEYDGHDRLAKLRFPHPDPGLVQSSITDFEAYEYDNAGNRTKLLRRGQAADKFIAFTYDALNREVKKDIPDTSADDVYTVYDLLNRKRSIRFGSLSGQGVAYEWDKAGRLSSETDTASGRALAYQYDKGGNRTRVTWPGAPSFYAGYVYDALNRMTAVNENGATSGAGLLATFAYDNLGRRTSLTRGNGAVTTYTYDNADRLTSLTQNLTVPADRVTLGWSYNPASQALARTATGIAYDWGNQVSTTKNYTHDGLNRDQAIAITPGGYDARGNLTYDGSRSFTYDLENRLLTASGTVATSLVYDPLGRVRTLTEGASATGMLHDGDRLSAEYGDVGLLLRRYVHGPGVDEPLVWLEYDAGGAAQRRWLHADNQGSVIAWSNASGAAVERYAYGPYGEPQGWTGSRFRYTGQAVLSEARLYHYKARAYDPKAGRFLQTDPIGYEDDLNLYPYVAGDPVNRTDPTGMQNLALDARNEIAQDRILQMCPDYACLKAETQRLADQEAKIAAVQAMAMGLFVGPAVSAFRGMFAAAESNAANRAAFEAYKDSLRASMERPTVSDSRLASIVDDLYRPNARVGNGSTAAAVRQELVTGKPVGGAFHSQKASDSITALRKWLERHPAARPGDRATAENLIRDLQNALRGQ